MLATNLILSCLAFGIIYPLCLCISFRDPIQHNFHRFHLGCPIVIAGLSIGGLLFLPQFPLFLKITLLVWMLCFLIFTAIAWNQKNPNIISIILLSISGLIFYAQVHLILVGGGFASLCAGFLSAASVALAFYTMNLGHFYLNVHGLKIHHLQLSVFVFSFLLALRLAWNVAYLSSTNILYRGESISLFAFSNTLDGFFIWIALFFAILMPLSCNFFAFETLKLKNTQATTGILYVLLSAVLLGDLTCKYYWIKFGIFI